MDLFLTQSIVNLRGSGGAVISLFITHLGDVLSITILSVILMLWLVLRLRLVQAIIFSAGMIFSGLFTQFLKLSFSRPRPDFFSSLPQDGFSFPSGHALGTIVFFGFLLFIILENNYRQWIKSVFKIALPLLILAIGFSRVYLGTHWISDVFAGWLIGGLILILMIKLVKYTEQA